MSRGYSVAVTVNTDTARFQLRADAATRPFSAAPAPRARSSSSSIWSFVVAVSIAPPRASCTMRSARALPARHHLLRDAVLRDLVGLDELHLVRHLVRHGRLALSGHDVRRRWVGSSSWLRSIPGAFNEGDFTLPVLGYVVIARRDGDAVSLRHHGRQAPAVGHASVRSRHRRSPGAVDPVPADPGGPAADRRVRALRALAEHQRPGVRRVPQADSVASTPHHRALRAVHAHRARREPARLRQRDHRRPRQGREPRAADRHLGAHPRGHGVAVVESTSGRRTSAPSRASDARSATATRTTSCSGRPPPSPPGSRWSSTS